jgi:hypothetical protein
MMCGRPRSTGRALVRILARNAADIAAINEAEPDFVWVGLGMPKQEKWMVEHLGKIKASETNNRKNNNRKGTRSFWKRRCETVGATAR